MRRLQRILSVGIWLVVKWLFSGMTVTPTTGNISLDSINITILIQPTGMPMPITTTYKGIIETRTGIDETSFNWDIALHRYDVKTNGASAVETTESDIKKGDSYSFQWLCG